MTDITGPDFSTVAVSDDARSVPSAMARGARGRCPRCGTRSLFRGYLKVADKCGSCGEEFHHHRADDAPPYITIFLVGHIIVPLMLLVEQMYHPPMWVHWSSWPAGSILLALVLLPMVKGAFVGLQWALRMHGFGTGDTADHGRLADDTLDS